MPEGMIAAYYLLAGSVLLWFGAETFVGCSSALALRIGLRPLVIGLTVVAFGTSSPELGVSLISSLRDLDGVATGNVVGSNIANIGLILGLAAVIRPIKVEPQLLRLDLPIVVGISFLVTLLFADGVLSRLGGALLLLLLVGYIGLLLRRSRPDVDVDVETSSIGVQTRKRSLPVIIGLAFFGLGMLVIGSFAFVNGAEDMALGLGVSPAVVGLTVVAIGTSLPEAATSVAAAWRGQGDIAVGNVVGSNVFNLLAILGITAVIRPISRGDVSMVSFGIMIALALLLLPVMRTGFRISRLEGAGLLASYAGYLYWLVP